MLYSNFLNFNVVSFICSRTPLRVPHLVITFPQAPLDYNKKVSQTSLVFGDLDSSEENSEVSSNEGVCDVFLVIGWS